MKTETHSGPVVSAPVSPPIQFREAPEAVEQFGEHPETKDMATLLSENGYKLSKGAGNKITLAHHIHNRHHIVLDSQGWAHREHTGPNTFKITHEGPGLESLRNHLTSYHKK